MAGVFYSSHQKLIKRCLEWDSRVISLLCLRDFNSKIDEVTSADIASPQQLLIETQISVSRAEGSILEGEAAGAQALYMVE